MAGVYWADIKTILAPGVACMANIVLATDEGVFEADLADYQTVFRLHEVIAAALNAWERDAAGNWVLPPKGTKENPMPPGGPLAVADVDKFLAWIDDGLPELPPMV